MEYSFYEEHYFHDLYIKYFFKVRNYLNKITSQLNLKQ